MVEPYSSVALFFLVFSPQADPESKCIVFSQWTTMLDLVEVSL